MRSDPTVLRPWSRRAFVEHAAQIGLAGVLGAAAGPAWAAGAVELPFVNGRRLLVPDFGGKRDMILLRTRPPLLETPFEVFDKGVLTPNDRFYVRWHLASIPTEIDTKSFRMEVRGHVTKTLSLTLNQLMQDFEPFEIVAVNQCSGNSRGFFAPRVAGGEWGHGAMGNARWRGVRLKDVLDRAGVRAGALQARFNGLDAGILPGTPDFLKSLAIDHARDGEVMIAYAMNDAPLPLLNGFPLRLVVPGWFATYWVKMLTDIEVLAKPDDNFWTAKAYLIPDTPGAAVKPGQAGVKMVPINRMVPRSFITSLKDGARVKIGGSPAPLRGFAFGGDCGVDKVFVSIDGGHRWRAAKLGQDYGKYSFRRWELPVTLTERGPHQLLVKAINSAGIAQPDRSTWNGGGYQRNVVESITVLAV